jgi:hypothetical protein
VGSRAKQFDSVAPALTDEAPVRILPTSNAAVASSSVSHPAVAALSQHWPEYLMEGAELGAFMISACVFGAILQLPGSPVAKGIPDPTLRRMLTGIAIPVTAFAILHFTFGKQSGAHQNPPVTLTFLRLGKAQSWDARGSRVLSAAQGHGGVFGPKLHHHNDKRCIFHCRFDEMKGSTQVPSNTNPQNS